MAEMPDVVAGETVEVEWGNDIRDRTVQRYANTTARGVENPSPSDGDLAFMEDTGLVWVYFDSLWRAVSPMTANVFEVDGEAQGDNIATGTSPAVELTVSLTIPSTWATWKCFAMVTGAWQGLLGNQVLSGRIRIDGDDQGTVQTGAFLEGTEIVPLAMTAHKTGLSTTGARDISLVTFSDVGIITLIDLTLYARAVRTS